MDEGREDEEEKGWQTLIKKQVIAVKSDTRGRVHVALI